MEEKERVKNPKKEIKRVAGRWFYGKCKARKKTRNRRNIEFPILGGHTYNLLDCVCVCVYGYYKKNTQFLYSFCRSTKIFHSTFFIKIE